MDTEKEGTVVNPEVKLEGAEIVDDLEEHNTGVEFDPLFDTETVTEAELMGEEAAGEKDATPDAKGDDPEKEAEPGESDEEKAEREKKEAEAEAEKTDAEKEAEKEAEEKAKAEAEKEAKDEPSEEALKKDEQIEGLTIAVRQERQTVSTLKKENQRLSAELEKAGTPEASEKEAEKWKDFKPLSEEEYDQLLADDSDEASMYLYKYNLWRDYRDTVNKRQTSELQAKTAEQEIVNYGIQALEEILPGITEGKNEMAVELTDFASGHGIEAGVLQILADPRTKITTSKGESLIMGDGAAQLIKLLKSTFEAVSNVPDESKIRTEIEAELRPKIEAEVREVFVEKLKQDPSGGSFRSLDNVTGGAEKEVKPLTGTVTEADYARMNEQEKSALLGA